MKNYIFCIVFFLINTQGYSFDFFSKKYEKIVFKKACLRGYFQEVQHMLMNGASAEEGLRVLGDKKKSSETHNELCNLLLGMAIISASCGGDLGKVSSCYDKGGSLFAGALALSEVHLLSDSQLGVFAYIVSHLSVQDRSLLLKQVMKNSLHNQEIEDKRIGILLYAGVVPYCGLGVLKNKRTTMGLQIGNLWNRAPHDFIERYIACFYHSDDSTNDQGNAEEKKRLASELSTLIHFARSEKGGRSVHLRKYPIKVSNQQGGTTKRYRVPSLKECAFDAWAQGLSAEEVASLDELTVANRRVYE